MISKSSKRFFGHTNFTLALALFVSLAAQAQSGKGIIKGHVVDPAGDVLQGAQVTLENADVSIATDVRGDFFIRDLPPGTYTLTVSYVGFSSANKTVDVVAGQVAGLDIKLEVASVNEQVLVTAERAAGEAEAINRERSADNIVQVLPADIIRSLPNANLADAIGRLPSVTLERDEGEGKYVQVRGTEPRLTNVTVDGVTVPSPESGIRQIKLDTIPSDLVESIEINKTLQANMDADGIGGSINLVTKTAGERPTVALSGMGGYTPIVGGRGVVETTGTIGQRFGSEKRLGILIGGSYDWNGRGIDDIEPVPDIATFPNGAKGTYYDSIDLREYRYYRSRWGLSGSADYRLAEGSSIYIRGLYSDFKNFGERWVYSFNDNNPDVSLLNDHGGTPSFNTQIRRPDYAIASVVLGGRHVFSSSWFTWDVSASRSRQIENGDPTAHFEANDNLPASACQFDFANSKNVNRPQWTPACFAEAYNPENLDLTEVDTAKGKTAQLNLQLTAAMARNYHLGSHLATIEFGGRFRNAHKFDDSFNFAFTPTDSVALSNFPSRFSNSDYYNNSYKLGPNPAFNDVFAFFNANQGSFDSESDPSSQFDLVEKVSAGYLMNTIDFSSRVRLVAGVRFEGTNLDVVGFDSGNNLVDLQTHGSYLKVLPSASLRIALDPNTYLRLVYGRGLSRPDPQTIAQSSFTFDSPGSPKNAVQLSNPGLKAETGDNFDILVEHYLNPFGELQAGFFYKRLTDPIVENSFQKTFQPAPTAPLDLYTVSQFINAGSAWVYGFEAAYIQHLSFLPGKLRGLGFSANYGYTNSRTSGLPDRSDHPRLLRSAPNTWNISPTYDRGRVSVRLGLSYNQANIFEYQFHDDTAGGLKGPNSDIYLYSHLQVDAQGSVRLAHGLNFIMYGLNLTNEVFGFYNGSPQYVLQREYYTPTIAAGFRWSPSLEKR